jgi:hypothetical protein
MWECKLIHMPIRAFCNTLLSRGDFCVIKPTQGFQIVQKYDSSVDDRIHGVSLNDVVNIDPRKDVLKEGEAQIGGMINVLTRGEVSLKVKGASLGAAVYVTKKGKAVTKKEKGRPCIGYVCSTPIDGFVIVRIEL